MINERIKRLRKRMLDENIDICIIPTSDCHNSEYLSDYYKVREYFSGFTGSAGTLVICKDCSALFTDGRYFIQAQQELTGSEISLMKMGEPGVPKLNEYLISNIEEGGKIAVDGKIITATFGENLTKLLQVKSAVIIDDFDPAKGIWLDRPKIKFNNIFYLDEKYTGESITLKLGKVKAEMKKQKADVHILSSLDDIAYLLNLRGNDIECCPLFFSYMIIDDEVSLFANKKALNNDSVIKCLQDAEVKIYDYDDFYSELDKRTKNWTTSTVLLDKSTVNYSILHILNGLNMIDKVNPSSLIKCIKNSTEIANIIKANIIDGVAMLRFNMWLDDELNNNRTLSEKAVVDKLLKLRKEADSFIEPSFDTIAGFGSNGAIVHYDVTADTNKEFNIKSDNFLLVDSGGHYLYGTTDVTRTYAIGEVSKDKKHDYTLVLRAMLRIMKSVFLYRSRGTNIDMYARELFWNEHRDFKHGTGHGIGYLLNVHEGPVRIGWAVNDNAITNVMFEAGMVTSDEPGIYIDSSHGIRIENDLVCADKCTNDYGRFLGFDPLTFVPIDLKCVLVDEMTEDEVKTLNDYHKLVYDKLSPCLSESELIYLAKVTKPIQK